MEVYQQDKPRDVLIFDAKYRRERASDGQFYPNVEDIRTMHWYSSSIQYRRYQPRNPHQSYALQKIVTSAYIFYPANKIQTEAEDRIAALPFLPNMSPQRLDDVRAQLKDLLYYAYLID